MKKLFVVLLILAVAGGLFAQEFTWTGEMKIGTILDLHTAKGDGQKTELLVDDDDGDGRAHAAMTLNYDNEGFHAELEFKGEFERPYDSTEITTLDAAAHIGGTISYEEEDWKVQVGLSDLEGGTAALGVSSLWGYWYFLDHKILLDVAYAGRETIYWRVTDLLDDNDWDNLDGVGGVQVNFLLMEGMSFGVKFGGFSGTLGDTGYPIDSPEFLETFFQPFVLGFKFEQESFALGFMYQNARTFDKNFVAMAKFFLGDTISVSGELLLNRLGGFRNGGSFGLGGNFDYHGDVLGAGITVLLEGFDPAGGSTVGNLVFKPYASFLAIEDTLLLKLDLVFGINAFRAKSASFISMEVTPAVYWNPMGDGISDDPSTGLIFKVMWEIGDFKNTSSSMETKVYTGFCWSF